MNELLQEGRYRVSRQIGQNETGAIYEGLDNVLEKKVFINHFTYIGRKNLSDEGKTLKGIKHEAFLRITDYFAETGSWFAVMEAEDGKFLSDVLRDEKSQFDFSEVVRWAERILDGFSYLHLNLPPIIYSDLKPQNIFLTADGEIKLLASAILKNRIADGNSASLSEAALQYSPLEQIWNNLDPASQKVIAGSYDESSERILHQKIDARSDIYALGVLMYQLLTGQFPKNALERSIGILETGDDPLISPDKFGTNVPPEITEILVRSLAVKRENRMDSAVIMRQILRTAFVRIKERESAAPEFSAAVAAPSANVNSEKFESLMFDDDAGKIQEIEKNEVPTEAEQTQFQGFQTPIENVQKPENKQVAPKKSAASTKEFGDWDEEDVLWLENSLVDINQKEKIAETPKTVTEKSDFEEPKAKMTAEKTELPKVEPPKNEITNIESPKIEITKIELPKNEVSEVISAQDSVKVVPETVETDYKKDYVPDQFGTLFETAEIKPRSKFGVPIVVLILFLIGGGAVGAWFFTTQKAAENAVQTQTETPISSVSDAQPQPSTEPEIQPSPVAEEVEKAEVPADTNVAETTPEPTTVTENDSENPVLSEPTASTAKKQTTVKQQPKAVPAKPQTASSKPAEKQPKKLTVDDLIGDN